MVNVKTPEAGPPPPILIIVGPTAVGKTEVTLDVARRLGGEVVSADSMQIYRGLDIGTAKPSPEERMGVPHHLIDIVEPTQSFSVADWVTLARSLLEAIRARGRACLVSGGTPLYHEALFGRFALAVDAGPQPEIRASLGRLAARYGLRYLHRQLRAVDPAAAARINPADQKRTVRALEVYLSTGRPLSVLERQAAACHRPPSGDAVFVGLWRPKDELARRIEARVQIMLSRGLVAEVERLYGAGLRRDLPAMQGVGYKEIAEHLLGRITLEEAARRMAVNTRRLAKRQMTWFRADPRIQWFRAGMNMKDVVEDIVTLAGGKA
jgi:tRNA dimethylallyltransferase